jgi:hypothetical protein
VLLVVALVGCGKGSPASTQVGSGSGSGSDDPFDGLSVKPDAKPDLASLFMSADERKRIEALDPKQVVSLRALTTLTSEDAWLLFHWKEGKVMDLSNVTSIGEVAAGHLSDWSGDALFIGAKTISPEALDRLASWKGTSLHLDNLDVDKDAAIKLAHFKGTILGLAHGSISPDAIAELKNFKGSVAIALEVPAESAAGAPPPAAGDDIETLRLISRAIDEGDTATVKDFLAHGGAVDMNEKGTTLLMEAVDHYQLDIVKLLLAAKANVNAVSSVGATPLYYALNEMNASHQDKKDVLAMVKVLVEAGADVAPKELRGELDAFPLDQAKELKDPALVSYLKSKGAK